MPDVCRCHCSGTRALCRFWSDGHEGRRLRNALSNHERSAFEPSGTGAPLTEVSLPPKQGDRLSEHLKTSAGESNFDVRKVVIRRSEIDALITGDIERSINCCNALIDNRLQEPGLPAPREVDWVVGVGNATRYPLFRELFDKHLKVAALDERYLLERENCKKAVAKGAVLALAMRTMAELVDIQFDSDLSNRLPYDVAYENLKSGRFRKMYDEHEKYEDMYQERQMSVLAHADHHLEDFVLMRRWPDEKDFSPFLRFHFPRGIQGSISLRYEPEEANFIAVDESNQKGERFEIELEGLYRSPLQRGDL